MRRNVREIDERVKGMGIGENGEWIGRKMA